MPIHRARADAYVLPETSFRPSGYKALPEAALKALDIAIATDDVPAVDAFMKQWAISPMTELSDGKQKRVISLNALLGLAPQLFKALAQQHYLSLEILNSLRFRVAMKLVFEDTQKALKTLRQKAPEAGATSEIRALTQQVLDQRRRCIETIQTYHQAFYEALQKLGTSDPPPTPGKPLRAEAPSISGTRLRGFSLPFFHPAFFKRLDAQTTNDNRPIGQKIQFERLPVTDAELASLSLPNIQQVSTIP